MRCCFFGILLLLTSSVTLGQNTHWDVYAKAGIQFGGPLYHSSSIVSKSGSPGFNPIIGIGVTYKLSKKWTLAAEVFYSRRKINYTSEVKNQNYIDHNTIIVNNQPVTFDISTTFTGTTKGTFDMHYLELPLCMQYAFGKKWNIQAGMYYAWAFSKTNKGTATGIIGRTDISNPNYVKDKEYNYSNELNTNYYGFVTGTQYQLSPAFSVDVRLTYSLKSLYKENWEGVPYTLKDLYGQFTVKYIFVKHND
ncbi:MAG TPA: outer membrane beta-barrel protein [Cytophaga sp.]|nr:outer membrane beta-barrel protein [Cytophaga sp.]